jgi:acetyl/propionyl-CoA carboxylase alpha subunit/acetyl-CoA carboxylase carboxyltransferase component
MPANIHRIAIVNRGEPAMRFIRAVREFNRERSTQIRSIVLYTTPDRHARFVREADEALDLGSAIRLDPGSGQRHPAYLDLARLESALAASRADAVWVGWGFVAERPEFADLCSRKGLTFLGPDGRTMRLLGDKIGAKRLAEEIGVPVIPWGGEAAHTRADALLHARKLGYPVLIKATAGEGGRGIRRAESEAGLPAAFDSARLEADRLFGNSAVYLEKWLPHSRHVEVQILADHHGAIWAVGTRDCTMQRRRQKLIEEAPAWVLRADEERALCEAAVKLARAASYRNAGTMEFLFDPVQRSSAFMEVNTRLQVEHPVTELTTGLDLVKMQIHIALGGRLEGEAPRQTGHAMEVRLNAEDSEDGFAPAPGTVAQFRVPTRPGLRLDAGVAEGDVIPADYDSMFAKLVAHASERNDARAILQSALAESTIVVSGGAANRTFLLQLLGTSEVVQDHIDVDWLDQAHLRPGRVSRPFAAVALLQSAIEIYDKESELEREQFFASAARMRPVVSSEPGRRVELRYSGHSYRLQVYRCSFQHYHVDVDGSRIEVGVDRAGPFERWITCFGRRHRVISVVVGLNHWVEVEETAHKISRDEAGIVRATAPSVVVSVDAKPGDRVRAGDRLALLEAMKMEIPVLALAAGTVSEVFVLSNSQVGPGSPLVRLDPVGDESGSAAAPRVSFLGSPAGPESPGLSEHVCSVLAELRDFMLGSDMPSADSKRLLEDYVRAHEQVPPDHSGMIQGEEQLLSIFADVSSLFRRQATPEDPEDAERLSAGEYLLTYLRNLESRGAGLPPSFVEKLRKALDHFGSDSLEPTPELKGRMLWIYKSHQQMERQVPIILAILERRLAHAEALAPQAGDAFRVILERLISAAENRFPSLSEIARDVRYRHFEQPFYARARAEVFASVREHLRHLEVSPGDPARIAALVDCPYPLMSALAGCFSHKDPLVRQTALEVLTRRYYRVSDLRDFSAQTSGERAVATATCRRDQRRIQLISTHVDSLSLCLDAAILKPALDRLSPDDEVVLDVYSWQTGPSGNDDTLDERLRAMLDGCRFSRPIHRVLVAVASPGELSSGGGTLHFTFQRTDNGYREEKMYRGIHPMMSERLQLWRLRNFRMERLPSAEGIYLFRCVALENQKDERLFALAEVRDLTPVRDPEGRIAQLPHLERMLAEALAGIRQEQLRRPPDQRLHWNRVLLYVWPAVSFSPEELQPIARRLARQTEGLGLEKVVLSARVLDHETGMLRETALSIGNPGGRGIVMRFAPPSNQPLRPLSEYVQKVVRMRQRQLNYPYEIIQTLAPESRAARADMPAGEFTELDLDENNRLIPCGRTYGANSANVVVGLIRNFTAKCPEGMTRVIVLGDPSKELGSIAEPECRRIIAALDLAQAMNIPMEWFSLSAGAKISMNSGTENMDWIARVLRRLIEFTQSGGEVNVIVTGINVGAQPYWNAEATMLMHTRGILIMMPESAMVLTGKTALDYSGSVSAEDNQGIGGYEHVMGPNGQAQYWAQDLVEACHILFRHYDHCYVMPGERFPRPASTNDPAARDIRTFPHANNGDSLALVGDIFSDEANPGRKKPFDIRRVMLAVTDQDHHPLERWPGMRDAEVAVVWDAHIGGHPVCLMGFESRSVARVGFVSTDGPEQWTSGTLFPMASKKVARAINACSGNRPLVILANLSGFDGSPESMRQRQLEFGAEIGRAIVNFKGPVVFCVISRYHGGAFVVFSRALNKNMQVVALEGTFASVIGGAPAAAVVFAREVENRTRKDPRLAEAEAALALATEPEKRRLRARLNELKKQVRSEKLGEVAEEFDGIHSVHRALKVGSLERIIPASELRPYLIDAIRRGIDRELNPDKS